jgi:DNA topoisomerase I
MSVEQNIIVAKAHAKEAGLRYVYDSDPGYTRKRRGKSFTYYDSGGKTISAKIHIERFKKLAIPPAWESVWICLHVNGHIQATGNDQRGRKQYRYHEEWRLIRDKTKFENMLEFGEVLPGIRRRVFKALNEKGLPREKIIAAIVRLLDKTGLRVGNDVYTEENHTFGLTTISKKHIDLHGNDIELDFPAKGGKVWKGTLTDPKVAKILSALEDIPGYRLFKYLDEDK